MVHSTRSDKQYSISEAILKGLAYDGGLFVFDSIKKINMESLYGLNYQDLAFNIFRLYLDDFSDTQIKWAIDNSYNKENFKEEIVKIKSFDKYSFLELFHGPTAAFKDMALTILPNLFILAKEKLNIKENTHIVVATSGDTGSATLSGFLNKKGIDVKVLYPYKKVSELQEKQMLYFSNDQSRAYALKGNFDDCQSIVKQISLENKNISSANSINIGRLIPQIVYYFYAYIALVENKTINKGELINVCVPTGNFGNILACYIAKLMGLPVDKLISASNTNNVLSDFINSGKYDTNRQFFQTYAPSMDIIVSSNIERLIYYFYNDTSKVASLYSQFNKDKKFEIEKELFKDFEGYFTTDDEILKEIKSEYLTNNYLIDPHTAVALNCYKKSNSKRHTLIVSTASPYKFERAILDAKVPFDINNATNNIKDVLKGLISNKIKDNVVDKNKVKEMVSCLK